MYKTLEDFVGGTPLVRLKRLPDEGLEARGNVILAKLEGNNPAGSVKDRPALSMIRRAEQRGEIKPGDTLIEATSGNTGIALAMAAAMGGYRLLLVMPENQSIERRQTMRAFGAELVLTPKSGGMELARDVAEKMQKEGNKPGKTGNKGKSGEGQGMSEELAKMAAQQEYLRNELQKLNQEQNKDGKNSLGNLEDLAKRMEETEKDIVNRMISEQTIKRQQDILTKLLESDRAQRERDQDEQRKSEEAKNLYHRNPAEFEEYKRLKLKEMELLRTVPPSLNSYYKQKVNDYFQSLEK